MARALAWTERVINHKTAVFRQVNQEKKWVHHDALEFPDGDIVLLTLLQAGQQVTVLQLPASDKAKAAQETEPVNWQPSRTEASAIGGLSIRVAEVNIDHVS